MAIDLSKLNIPMMRKGAGAPAAEEGEMPTEDMGPEEGTPAPGPLADASDEDLLAECTARGLV